MAHKEIDTLDKMIYHGPSFARKLAFLCYAANKNDYKKLEEIFQEYFTEYRLKAKVTGNESVKNI